jgi:hypothetical protein
MVLPLWAAVMPEDGEVGDVSEPEEEGEVVSLSRRSATRVSLRKRSPMRMRLL